MEGQVSTMPQNFSVVAHRELWEHMNTMAKTFHESKALPGYLQNAAQIMVVMQTGSEMGFKFMESIRYLYIINGSITLNGVGAIRRLKEAGYIVEYVEKENECRALVLDSDGNKLEEETVTFAEAEKSGYTTTKTGDLKPGWVEGMNRKVKLRYLAVSTIVKTKFPEVLGAAVDITEVAEDYIIEKEITKPKFTRTKGDKQEKLNEFIEKQKRKQIEEGEVVNGNIEESPKGLEAEDEEPVDPLLANKRKEFFAVAKELEWEPEEAKEEIKKYFKEKSFKDLRLIELSSYIMAMRKRIIEKHKKDH